AAVVAPVREETVSVTRRAQVAAFDLLDAGRPQRTLGGGPQVEPAVACDVLPEGLTERHCNLLPHLVAARPDARTDRRGELAGADRPHARSDDPGEQATPAGVQDLDRGPEAVRARNRDRQAVGGEKQHRAAGLV